MTFAVRSIFGMLRSVFTAVTATLSNLSISTGVLSCGLTVNTDGTITYSSGSGSANWVTPTGTGVGTPYFVKLTISGVTNTVTTGTTATWLPMTSAQTWSFSNTPATLEGSGSFALSFAADAAGASIVGSGSGTWHVGKT